MNNNLKNSKITVNPALEQVDTANLFADKIVKAQEQIAKLDVAKIQQFLKDNAKQA